MANIQGTSLIETQYFTNLTNQINSINDCGLLQELVSTVFSDLNSQLAALEAELAKLSPFAGLLTMSITDLGSVISFINELKNLLTTLLGPVEQYITQAAELTAAIAQLAIAVENAAARLINCNIEMP